MEWYLKVIKEHYADFAGRARRKEYWMFVLVNMCIVVVLQLLARAVSIVSIVAAIYGLATLVPSVAACIRRLHDIGKTGWFTLLAFVPLANFYLIYLLAQDGQRGGNAYGADPKA